MFIIGPESPGYEGYVFLHRGDWDASVDFPLRQLRKPVDEVYLHHSVTRATASPCDDTATIERILDQRGLEGYNYVIHPSGVVSELAGERRGEHTYGKNSTSIGICFVGNFDNEQITMAAIVAASRTINLLRLKGDLVADLDALQILHHRQVRSTACPGANNEDINGRPLRDWVRWFAATL